MIIDGKKIAAEIIAELKTKLVLKKFLAVFVSGDDVASLSFVEKKREIAEELGADFRVYRFPSYISQDELREMIGKAVRHKTCGGALVQLPLPKGINRHYVLNAIPREKDVDVLGERALGAFYTGRNPIVPPPVATVQKILSTFNFQLSTAVVAVVGLGILIGKPIAHWLEGKTKELYLLDARSGLSVLKDADLVITGTGHAGLIKPEMLKDGAGVIDFGYAQGPNGTLLGDLDTSELINLSTSKLGFYTPTPGGTGPIVVATLFQNFYILNR